MGEETGAGRVQKPAGILKRCQEIGSATGMCWLLCISLCLNVVLICILANGMHNSVGTKCQFFLYNNFVQREFGAQSPRSFANSVSGKSLTRHVHWVHAIFWECCSMAPIQMCHAWQMRANANTVTTAAIFISKAIFADKVGAMACSQLYPCQQ